MKYSTKKGGKRKNKNKSKRRQPHIKGGAAGDWYTYVYQTKTPDSKKKLFRLCNEGNECYYIISNALPDDVEEDIKTMWDALVVRLNSNNKFKDIKLPEEEEEMESVKEWGNAPAAVVVPVSEEVSSNIVKEVAPVSSDVVTEVAPVSEEVSSNVVKEVAPVVKEEVSSKVVKEDAPVVKEDAHVVKEVANPPETNLLDEPLNKQVISPTLSPMISVQETPASEVQSPEASAKLALEQKPLTEEERRQEEAKSAQELINNAVKEELNKKKNLVNQPDTATVAPAPAELNAPLVKNANLPDVFQESGPQKENIRIPPPPPPPQPPAPAYVIASIPDKKKVDEIRSLKNQKQTVQQLRKSGHNEPSLLIQAGFTPKELRDGGFIAKDLLKDGLTKEQVIDAGFAEFVVDSQIENIKKGFGGKKRKTKKGRKNNNKKSKKYNRKRK